VQLEHPGDLVTILPQSVTVTYTPWPRRQEPAWVHPDLHVSGWPRVTVAADCVPAVASRSMFSTRTSCRDLTGDSRAGTPCSQAIVAAVLPGVASQTMLFCIANDRALCTRSYVSVQMTPVLRGHVKAQGQTHFLLPVLEVPNYPQNSPPDFRCAYM
jgi:hypothetical protein